MTTYVAPVIVVVIVVVAAVARRIAGRIVVLVRLTVRFDGRSAFGTFEPVVCAFHLPHTGQSVEREAWVWSRATHHVPLPPWLLFDLPFFVLADFFRLDGPP